MIRLPSTPVERPMPNSQQAMEDQRQLGHWREALHRMFDCGGSITGTPGAIGAGAVGTLSVVALGCFADKAQTVEVGAPSTVESGLFWSAYVSANDVVMIRIYNATGAPITPASGTWTVRVTP